jgi:hypothetical protein
LLILNSGEIERSKWREKNMRDVNVGERKKMREGE